MKAYLEIVELKNDIITTSGGFNPDDCDCYDTTIPGDPCDDE